MFGNYMLGCLHATIGLMMMREKEGSKSNGKFGNDVVGLVKFF
jgi:hypothetical protein